MSSNSPPFGYGQEPGIQVQTSAAALAIYAFMLSKWPEDAREGP